MQILKVKQNPTIVGNYLPWESCPTLLTPVLITLRDHKQERRFHTAYCAENGAEAEKTADASNRSGGTCHVISSTV